MLKAFGEALEGNVTSESHTFLVFLLCNGVEPVLSEDKADLLISNRLGILGENRKQLGSMLLS